MSNASFACRSLANPKWDEEFNIPLERVDKLVEGDDNEINLTVDIYDDNYIADTKLGTAVIKLKKLFMGHSGLNREQFYDCVPAGGGRIKLSITWWQANKGALLLTLVDGHNLRVPGVFKSAKGMDPYCMVRVGGSKIQTKTVSNGGKNPVFNNEEHLIWCDEKR